MSIDTPESGKDMGRYLERSVMAMAPSNMEGVFAPNESSIGGEKTRKVGRWVGRWIGG